MRGLWGRKWLVAVVSCGAVAVAIVVVAVSCSLMRSSQRAVNQAQLKHACAGLLPQRELRGFVPSDSSGALEQYGTMLDPHQESRALLDCTLSWGAGRWEPDAQVRVRAEAVLATQGDNASAEKDSSADGDSPGDFALPLPPGAKGSTGAEDRLNGSEVDASLRVGCPNGLTGRKLPSKLLSVSVALPSKADSDYDVSHADRLLAARTAVRVANWVTREQNCGRDPISTEGATVLRTGRTPTQVCSWLDPKALNFAESMESEKPYDWRFTGDSAYNQRAGSCGGQVSGLPAYVEDLPVDEVKAESWAGEFARGAWERYADTGDVPGRDKPSPATPGGKTVIKNTGLPPELALWAKSVCDGGRSYHRIAITVPLEFGDQDEDDEVALTRAQRKKLSSDARATLRRYLADGDAWPKRSHCRDTTILGEVEEWAR